jgi:diguanylate cyclase (GGDEF)-like protein/PAS domain S-box-containing protein
VADDSDDDLRPRLAALRQLYDLIGRVNGARGLRDVLQSVVNGAVEGLGFGIAVVNLVHEDGTLEVVAVAGSPEASAELLGRRSALEQFEAEFAAAEHWGGLRFVPHERLPAGGVAGWVPPAELAAPSDDPDAWHPLDALFAPLIAADGALVGIMSVDLPEGGRRPNSLQRELLEMFATQAGIAVDNARLAERLRASEESFRLAFDGAFIGMTMTSVDPRDPGRFLRVNPAMCELVGYTAEELAAMTFADITHPDDLPMSLDALDAAVTGRALADREEKRYVRRDGSVVWVAITSSVIQLESGENLHAITQVEDITARRAAEAEFARRANHDTLTGLLNRTGLLERLQADLAGWARRRVAGEALDRPGAVLYCDLDGFKGVNDTHGHAAGDEVLSVVASRLVEQVRDHDAVARLGGDEFVILAEGVTLTEAVGLAERIERCLAAPMQIAGLTARVTVSIGIAALDCLGGSPGPANAAGTAALLHAADTAMYEAKANGRNRHAVYRPGAAPR